MRRTRQRLAIVAIALPLGFVACGSDDAADGETAPPAAEADPADDPVVEADPADDPVVEADPADVDAPSDDASADADQQYPDIVEAVASLDGDTWTFDVTVSSPYDTPERYADGWRILSPDGEELGFRELTHDHASEQPFTRTLDGVEIPDDVDVVTIEGRDQANGFGGETVEVTLPR